MLMQLLGDSSEYTIIKYFYIKWNHVTGSIKNHVLLISMKLYFLKLYVRR